MKRGKFKKILEALDGIIHQVFKKLSDYSTKKRKREWSMRRILILIFFTLLMGTLSYLAGKEKGFNRTFLLVLLGLVYGIYLYILL